MLVMQKVSQTGDTFITALLLELAKICVSSLELSRDPHSTGLWMWLVLPNLCLFEMDYDFFKAVWKLSLNWMVTLGNISGKS